MLNYEVYSHVYFATPPSI